MRIGKVKESILKRSVLRQLHMVSESGSPILGEDAGNFLLHDSRESLSVSVNPVTGWTLAAERAVYGAVNALAAAQVSPKAIAVTILLPKETEEGQLRSLMKEMDVLCAKEQIRLVAGHTEVSAAVNTLVMSVSALGVPLQVEVRKGRSLEDMEVVMAGTAAAEGTAMIAIDKEKELTSRYAEDYLHTAKELFDEASMQEAAAILRENGTVKMHDLREGGVFGGLWELAAATKVGLDIDIKRIPIRQHTIEVCEFFSLNPYLLRSGGALLALCEDGQRAVDALREKGIRADVIGRTTDGNDRTVRYDDEIRFLEPPKQDEIYKIQL